MTRFSLFSALCTGEDSARDFISRFGLFAILVPGSDSGKLTNIIGASAREIVDGFGPDGLFVSYTGEPRSWSRNREDAASLAFPEGTAGYNVTESLQLRLSLPEQSCIVLTSDLTSSEFIILPTSNRKAVAQLKKIGELLRALPGCAIDSLADDLNEPGAVPFPSFTEDGQPLVRVLADLEAIMAMYGSQEEEPAREWIRGTLASLEKASQTDAQDDEADSEAIARYNDYLAMASAVPQHTGLLYCCNLDMSLSLDGEGSSLIDVMDTTGMVVPEQEFKAYIVDNLKGLGRISRKALRDYHDLLPYFFREDDTTGQEWDDQDDDFLPYDRMNDILENDFYSRNYAPLFNYLAQVMEEELNASIVQLIRTYYAIQMPPFFRLFDNSKDYCSIQTKKKKINFNERGKALGKNLNEVKKVMLGELGLCLGGSLDTWDWAPQPWEGNLDAFEDGRFRPLLKEFSGIRNRTSHSGAILNKEGFIAAFGIFKEIMDTYYPKMLELKLRLGARKESKAL